MVLQIDTVPCLDADLNKGMFNSGLHVQIPGQFHIWFQAYGLVNPVILSK